MDVKITRFMGLIFLIHIITRHLFECHKNVLIDTDFIMLIIKEIKVYGFYKILYLIRHKKACFSKILQLTHLKLND